MRATDTPDEKLLREIIKAFTQHPEDIEIKTEWPSEDRNLALITFRVHQDDHAPCVGIGGQNIEALRTIFNFIGHREKMKIKLMLLEPVKGRRGFDVPFEPNPNWKPEKLVAILRKLLARIFVGDIQIDVISSASSVTTNIDLMADRRERDIMDLLLPYLKPIFHAIGKSQGRQVYLATAVAIPTAASA